jgi:integrase
VRYRPSRDELGLEQVDRKQLLRYVKFLRDHESDLDDRTVHNIFETLNTFLRTRDLFIAGKILAELDYAEKPPKPYTKQELKDMFGAMDEEEKLLYGLFLNSGVRDAEMQNTEYADFNWEKGTLHVQPKPWRKFRLKGKSKKKSAKDRFIPIPAKLVWKIKERMRERKAQPHDLVFPNGEGKPDGHFLRKLKAIAKKAGVEGAELHRFRKTYADTLHEEGVSVNTIRIRLGHESLDVTLAYLKGQGCGIGRSSRARKQQQLGTVRISKFKPKRHSMGDLGGPSPRISHFVFKTNTFRVAVITHLGHWRCVISGAGQAQQELQSDQ